MSNMEPWTRQLLSVIVSQLCKTIGWHSISTTCLQILVNVLHCYLKKLGTNIHDYTEHFNHTFPTLEEINLAFGDMGVNIENLKEYVDYVTPIPIKTKVPKYPLEKKSNLNFLKPGSREVVTRPVHIHEHLPAMFPNMSEDNYISQESSNDDSVNLNLTDIASNSLTKPGNAMNAIQHKLITNLIAEHVGRPVRELSCVIMTTSGFLSPAREGKLPEPRLPKVMNYSNNVSEPSSYLTVPPEDNKNEHKKASHSKSSSKSAERKVREERTNSQDTNDDAKVKKMANVKELSKLKAFKPTPNKSIDGSEISKVIRQEKLKLPKSIGLKEVKSSKPPKPNKITVKPSIPGEEKLATEPNRQKLNIFRRISKVKDDRSVSPVPKIIEDKNTSINESIESVIKRSVEKEEVISAPSEHLNSSEPTTLIPNTKPSNALKRIKRKKKQKIRDGGPINKKIKLAQEATSPVAIAKPTELEPPPYSFFTKLQSTPDLMSPSLKSNILIPQIFNPFMNVTKRDPNCPHPEMPDLPLPPRMIPTTPNNQKSPINALENDKKLDSVGSISDKKLKKKMKKDKREKDKKKKEKKDKIKNKEKLTEKKKERILKKVKNREKLKKREKLNVIESSSEDPSTFPKLKLIINGPNSPQPSSSGLQSPKIVIKPIIKHDENSELVAPLKEDKQLSPQATKISNLIVKPPKQKSLSKISSEPTFEPTSYGLNSKVKKSPVIGGENKSKNKEKQKLKKMEETKPRPDPFYYDAEGNQVWVCPSCGGQDDGSPMIGCDGCDAWYHWVCVGIESAPESIKWFCGFCRND